MKKNILIIDFHIGLIMEHKALFEKLGHNVQILSLSGHTHFLKDYFPYPSPPTPPVRLHRYLNTITEMASRRINKMHRDFFNAHISAVNYRRRESAKISLAKQLAKKILLSMTLKKHLLQADYILCSFPPILFYATKMIMNEFGLDKPIILTMGHRFNIRVNTKAANELLKREILLLHEDDRHIVGAMHEYDYQYAKNYLGIHVEKTYLQAFHIPLKKPVSPSPSNTILLGPAHNRSLFGFAASVTELNEQYHSWCCRLGIEAKYNFDFIKNLHRRYKIDDLREYAGVVIFPYSAYSISMIELYTLNLPFFAPSVDLIIKHNFANDRVLFPIYCTKEQYEQMENDGEGLDSPNSYHPDAQRKWLQYAYYNCKENVLTFNSKEHLFRQVSQLPNYQGDLSSRMYEENRQQREGCLQLWQGLLEKI